MKPSILTIALEAMIDAQQPVFIEGAPGIGKSQIVAQTCKRMGLDLIDIRAVLLDPVDLRGLPHVNGDGRAHWALPDFLPRKGKGVVFLDELNRAPTLVQNACLQLVLDRRLGEYVLPKDWAILAAGNASGSGVTKMDPALRSRFVFIDAEIDLADWSTWAIQSDIAPEVIAFIRWRSDLLHNFDGGKERSFPCPRSWEFVSRVTKSSHGNKTIEHELFIGSVGKGAATEYSAFLQLYRNLPNIDAILLDPKGAKVPNSPATLYAVSAALARRMDDKTIARCITYLDRLPQEYAVYAVRDAITRDGGLASVKEFTKWAIAHQDVVF